MKLEVALIGAIISILFGVHLLSLLLVPPWVIKSFLIISFWIVGYGDFYPKTTAGRVIAVLACFAGQFFVSLIVTTITNMVEFSDPQSRAYKKMKSLDLKMRLEVARSNMIKFFYLYYKDRQRNRDPEYVETYNKYYTKFMINLNAYKATRK